jgi:type VI secretion system protein ImpK
MSSPASSVPFKLGNLALAYQETFTSIVRLRSGRQTPSDSAYFREQFIEALKLAQEEGRARGYSDAEIRHGRFAVTVFLDETILNLRKPVFADWARRPLQEEFFRGHTGGEVFFQNIEEVMREPDAPRLADVLEIYLLCICLGYAGKYSISGRGELSALRQSLIARIRRIRGEAPEFSPAWKPVETPHSASSGDRWLSPLLWTAIGTVVVVLGLFGVYMINLNSAVGQVQSIASTGASTGGK